LRFMGKLWFQQEILKSDSIGLEVFPQVLK
jgi:hypothetical protein